MRDYRFDFSNGTTDLVEAFSVRTGYVRFYELLSGGGVDPRIRVESMGGGWAVVLRPGQGFRLPAEEQAGVVITNLAGTAMAGLVKLGPRDWEFEDQRLTGTVAVVDSNFALTSSGLALIAFSGLTPAANQYAYIQVLNPAASGKIVEVQSILYGVGAVSTPNLFITSGLTLSANVANGVSSKLASSAPLFSTQIRTQSDPAILSGRQIMNWFFSSQGNAIKDFKCPILLNPGDSLMMAGGLMSTSLAFGAEVVERPQV